VGCRWRFCVGESRVRVFEVAPIAYVSMAIESGNIDRSSFHFSTSIKQLHTLIQSTTFNLTENMEPEDIFSSLCIEIDRILDSPYPVALKVNTTTSKGLNFTNDF
jgi:hypothetical protein